MPPRRAVSPLYCVRVTASSVFFDWDTRPLSRMSSPGLTGFTWSPPVLRVRYRGPGSPISLTAEAAVVRHVTLLSTYTADRGATRNRDRGGRG